jgi:hypothetical protein
MEGRTMILIMAPLKAKAAAVAERARDKEGQSGAQGSGKEDENPQGGEEAL